MMYGMYECCDGQEPESSVVDSVCLETHFDASSKSLKLEAQVVELVDTLS